MKTTLLVLDNRLLWPLQAAYMGREDVVVASALPEHTTQDERIVYIDTARSILTDIRPWDFILPHTFIDHISGNAYFLESYGSNEDLNFESFCVRVGGIHVSSVAMTHSDDADQELLSRYEMDSLSLRDTTEHIKVLAHGGAALGAILVIESSRGETLDLGISANTHHHLQAFVTYLLSTESENHDEDDAEEGKIFD